MRFGVNEQKQPVILAKAGKVPPCMDYYIGLCPAPCLLEQDKIQAHSQNVEALKKFLRGQMGEVLTELRETMMKRAKDQQFEEAQKIKEQIEAIGMLGQKQIARDAVR
jgi:excinuclease ABC subunit C